MDISGMAGPQKAHGKEIKGLNAKICQLPVERDFFARPPTGRGKPHPQARDARSDYPI